MDHNYEQLGKDTRAIVTQALIQLMNRSMVSRFELLPVFFKLFQCQDKSLRQQVFSHIVNDVAKINRGSRDQKVNARLKNFMYKMLKHPHPMVVKKCLDIMIELWRRKVWTDAGPVNAISELAFSRTGKVKAAALRFFLGFNDSNDDTQGASSSNLTGNASMDLKNLYMQNANLTHVKRRKKRLRAMERAKKRINRMRDGDAGASQYSIAAIHLLYDAQAFADRLFSALRKSTDPFELRLLMMNVCTRLIGTHKLLVLNIYPYIQKYLNHGQQSVTRVLAYLAQASHDMVPPDDIRPTLRAIADNFVSDRSSPEVMAVGINAIREVCARCPLAMTPDLLQDLTQFKKSKFKGVMMAARSLIATFRELAPAMLHRKDRGKEASINPKTLREYGDVQDGSDSDLDGLQYQGGKAAQDKERDGSGNDQSVVDKDVKATVSQGGQADAGPAAGAPTGAAQQSAKRVRPQVRFLTAKDFRKLKAIKARRSAQAFAGRKRDRTEISDEGPDSSDEDADNIGTGSDSEGSEDLQEGEVDVDAIVGYVPRKKRNKEERLAQMRESREGRSKKWALRNPSGTTNREKLKNKPFMMVKASARVARKKNLTLTQQQRKSQAHIKSLKKMSKKKLKSMRK